MGIEEETTDTPPGLNAPPPSIQPGPLIDSYTWHSSTESPTEEEYMLGIDEAGRGPVLGPMVYAAAFAPCSFETQLKELGFADSKTLTHERRNTLLRLICSRHEDLKWSVRVMSPSDLSRAMLQKSPYNLNAQAHDGTIALIHDILRFGYRITQCFVDTVGPAATYQKKLASIFPLIDFTVCSKADSIYPIVGAASIAAKVTRDYCIEAWESDNPSNNNGATTTTGSGYPSDPKTVNWLKENLDPVFGYPTITRFSWQTVKTLLENKAMPSRWCDEPARIQKFFTKEGGDQDKSAVWKDLCVQSVGTL